VQARNAGITRSNIAKSMQAAFEGVRIGVYREKDELLPIIGRSPENERDRIDYIQDIQIWSPVAQKSIPITQTVIAFESRSENSIVRRRNRLPTITVKCDPASEQASVVFERLRPKVEAIPLPSGYQVEWGGEYENSRDAQSALATKIPPAALLMVLILIVLFNNLRQPLIILLTVPLAVIGVTAGLLLTNQPFGFMALLGFMSLSGMLIKNAIVLIDEINTQLADGRTPFLAILDSGVSRVRPVSMAALTTVLGMVPLLPDAFFVSMAVTIMFGLTFATILTLIVVPVLYVIFYRIPYPDKSGVQNQSAVSE
jgi:multidrug efflux pump subunit AcrB